MEMEFKLLIEFFTLRYAALLPINLRTVRKQLMVALSCKNRIEWVARRTWHERRRTAYHLHLCLIVGPVRLPTLTIPFIIILLAAKDRTFLGCLHVIVQCSMTFLHANFTLRLEALPAIRYSKVRGVAPFWIRIVVRHRGDLIADSDRIHWNLLKGRREISHQRYDDE